jgi:hypothetical protein
LVNYRRFICHSRDVKRTSDNNANENALFDSPLCLFLVTNTHVATFDLDQYAVGYVNCQIDICYICSTEPDARVHWRMQIEITSYRPVAKPSGLLVGRMVLLPDSD